MTEQPTFVKRVINKGNMRKRVVESDTTEDEVNTTNQSDVKLQQSFRIKGVGASLDSLTKRNVVKTAETTTTENKNVENVLGSQFSAQSDGGDHNNVLPHEKIMEKFIDDRLGLTEVKRFTPAKILTEDDKLYLVPDNIKNIVLGGDQELAQEQKRASTSASSGTSTGGIAEVTLPESFKLKNIAATVQATEKLKHIDYLVEQQNKRSRQESGYYQRFHHENNNATALTSSFMLGATAELGLDDNELLDVTAFTAIASAATPISTTITNSNSTAVKNSNLKSSDDQALNKYKKQQGYRR